MRWFALLLVLVPLQARADVKSELGAVYARIAKAMKAKDVTAISRHVATDYRQVGLDGKAQGRAATEADHRATFAASQSVDMKVAITSLKAKGKEAVATVRYTVTMVTKPEADPQRRVHRVSATVPLRHTWKKTARGWLLHRSQELKGGLLSYDGKPQPIRRN